MTYNDSDIPTPQDEDEIRGLYRSLRKEEPAQALDMRIQQAAQAALRPGRFSVAFLNDWRTPLVAAAIGFISLSLLLQPGVLDLELKQERTAVPAQEQPRDDQSAAEFSALRYEELQLSDEVLQLSDDVPQRPTEAEPPETMIHAQPARQRHEQQAPKPSHAGDKQLSGRLIQEKPNALAKSRNGASAQPSPVLQQSGLKQAPPLAPAQQQDAQPEASAAAKLDESPGFLEQKQKRYSDTEKQKREKSAKPAEQWVGEIERLLDEGKRDEAKASLKAFRTAYPSYKLKAPLQTLSDEPDTADNAPETP